MKTFVELVQEIKKSFDKEDRAVLANIEDSIELTSTAQYPHAVGSFFIFGKTVCETTVAIAANDTIAIGTNCKVADDIMAMLAQADGKIETIKSDLTNEVVTRSKVSMHNFFQNKLKSQTLNGVTFTVNADKSITANGTASDNIYLMMNDKYVLPQGDYMLTLKATGTYTGYTDCRFDFLNNGTWVFSNIISPNDPNFPNGLPIKFVDPNYPTTTEMNGYWYIESGTVLNSFTIYPMLRLATDANSDYEPYSMTNQELTPIAQAVSNRNLLDNPWFTVNQRGITNITTDWNYFVDRWRTTANVASTVTVTSDGIHVEQTADSVEHSICSQVLEYERFDLGKPYTLSILFSDGTVESISAVISKQSAWARLNGKTTSKGIAIAIDADANYVSPVVLITVNNTVNATIRAMKLEKGTVSTLAMDTAPNYAEELLKCQRYFYRLINKKFIAVCSRDTNPVATFDFPVKMRTNPSLGETLFSTYSNICLGEEYGNLTGILSYELTPNSAKIFFDTNLTTAAIGKVGDCELNNYDPCHIDFSADL